MDRTPNLDMPFILPSQAQKHVTHNEALWNLDALVQLGVLDRDLTSPPASPDEGDRYIVAAGGSDDWSGHDGEVAVLSDGAWAFYPPREGWIAWIADEDALLVFDGTDWSGFDGSISVLQNLSLLGVGTTADATNPLSAKLNNALLTALETGSGGDGDLRIKANKEAEANTVSYLFQTGYSGRAEFGLVGNDDFTIKVSADGSTWNEALIIDKSTGAVSMPHTALAGAGDFKADGSVAMSGDLDMGGNAITNVGNVDGRDVSADGAKLDGIETGATADQTAQEVANAIDADATAEGILKSALDVSTATDLASTANGKGASLIGIEDSAGNFTGTDVEAALAELAAGGGGGTGVTDGDKGDITVSASGAVWSINAEAVTYAKLQNVSATALLLGRNSAGAGMVEEIAPGDVRSMLNIEDGATGDQTAQEIANAIDADATAEGTLKSALDVATATDLASTANSKGASLVGVEDSGGNFTGDDVETVLAELQASIDGLAVGGVADGDKGDVIVSSSGTVWTVDAGAITYAKMQNVSATSRLLGRVTAGAGVVEEIAPADARTMLGVTSATDLASTANTKGASLIGVEDSAGNFSSGHVEGALAELKTAIDGVGAANTDDLWAFAAKLAMNQATMRGAPADFIGEIADSFEDDTGFDAGSSTNAQVAGGVLKPTGSSMESSANPAGSTIGGYTFVERTWAVDNDKDVTHIGASSNVAFSCVLKILKRNSAGNYDIVVSESHSHGGTGWEDHELASPFTVPSTGEYHVALYFAAGPTIPANSTTRAYKAGDVTGTGQTGFGEDTSNCPALRVTYAAGLDDMEAWLEAVALPAEPDTIDFYGVRTDNEAITVNNDLIVKASIDGGSTFATGTIEDVGTAGVYTVFRVIGIDVSSQTGTSLVGRIETANGKNIEINATFMRGY